MGRQIVVVDDDRATLDLIDEVLQGEGYKVCCYSGQRVSVASVQHAAADLVIVELQHLDPDKTLVFLDQLRHTPATKHIPVIVTSTSKRLLHGLAKPLHHFDCATLEKPFDLDDFRRCIDRSLNLSQRYQYAGDGQADAL